MAPLSCFGLQESPWFGCWSSAVCRSMRQRRPIALCCSLSAPIASWSCCLQEWFFCNFCHDFPFPKGSPPGRLWSVERSQRQDFDASGVWRQHQPGLLPKHPDELLGVLRIPVNIEIVSAFVAGLVNHRSPEPTLQILTKPVHSG